MAGRKRPKGYAPWSPQMASARLVDDVREVLEENEDYLPLTIRQVFYRLVAAYGYPKNEAAYKRLIDKLGRARRAGLIPFGHLRDDGVSVMGDRHYGGMDDFYGHVKRLGAAYERDKLARQGCDVRVLCESAGMIPQLHRSASPYSVPVYSGSGFDSLTAKHDLALAVHDGAVYRGKPTVILHLGDYDPSGVSLYESIKEDVHAFLSEDVLSYEPEQVAVFHRVALVPSQIDALGLTTYPPKASDSKAGPWIRAGLRTCQLEALPPDLLARVLQSYIEHFLDSDLLAEDRAEEQHERRQIALALPRGN